MEIPSRLDPFRSVAIPVLLAMVLVAACAAPAPPSSGPTGPAPADAALRAMDACLERSGYDLISSDAEGRSSIDFSNDDPDFRAVFERCQTETGFSGFGPPSLTPDDQARSNEQRQEMIACMGERGWTLTSLSGPINGVVLPDIPAGQQDVFNRDLAECGGGDMVGAEPVLP